MLVKECLNTTTPKITSTSSAVEVFDRMKTSNFQELPVVDSKTNTFLGMISEREILADVGVKKVSSLLSPASQTFVYEDDSALEALRHLNNSLYTHLPVLDTDRHVLGLVSKLDLVSEVAKSFHYDLPGSVLLLLVEQRDFSMHHLLRIIEQEGVKVLACSTSEVENEPNLVRVTVKLNQFDSGKVSAALRRYDYVIESVSDKVFEQDFLDKADEFLHFLNI